jgi:hypothetical protein
VVADYGLTLGDCIGVINSFFLKLGITRLRYRYLLLLLGALNTDKYV